MSPTFISADGATRTAGGGTFGTGGQYATPLKQEATMTPRSNAAPMKETLAWAAEAIRAEHEVADCIVFDSSEGRLTAHAYFGMSDRHVPLSPQLETAITAKFVIDGYSADTIARNLPDHISSVAGTKTVMIPLNQLNFSDHTA
jgi:hypothetical protein